MSDINRTEETAKAVALPVPEFLTGQLARLRPVVEADLEHMARLLAEAPVAFGWEGKLWTAQRLRKQFEDEKQPGLWSRQKRWYAVTDMAGELCGAFAEELGRLGGCQLDMHIALARADRDELGPDALAAFIEYKRGWQNCPRIECGLLETQAAERGWLQGLGFVHDIRCAEAWLHEGALVAIDMFSWLAPWVSANRSADGIGKE